MKAAKEHKPQQSRVISNVKNNRFFTQFYKPEGFSSDILVSNKKLM